MGRRVNLTAMLVLHLSVAAFHGATHSLVPVGLPAWQNAIIVGTTFAGPILGVVLVWRRHPLGVPLFTVTITGAFLVGGYLHFVLDNPDHIHAIPASPWRLPFQVSSVAVATTEAVGTVLGSWYWQTRD